MQLCRNRDKTDLIIAGNNSFSHYWSALQSQERFVNTSMANGGFTNLKFNGADVVLDGGQGGSCPTGRMYFLNTNYIHWRPHSDMNMDAMGGERFATNQDATVELIGWQGNMTVSNRSLQGVLGA